jgi:hypothetical protein
LQIERGPADHFEKLACGRLLLKRDSQVCVPGVHLLDQPCVLNGDDGLVGEGSEEIDLSVGEAASLGASDRNCADGLGGADQRDAQHRAEPKAPGTIATLRILLRSGLQVGDVNGAALKSSTSGHGAT